ncbi:MAG: ribosome maturation factor RimP [Eubacteriales bacterium]|nr:ribosome maturation factor RimP [Eubacteriales bacterium]MDD4324431.1 ribosome maturation factor RimP [Eubacteriales bacterium]MDD4541253.1 ribosome maturation factor RimP [Eubacteriales bacterium]
MKTLSEKDRIMEKISPVAESLGLELIDVETERAGDRSILRLIADRRGGITLDELTELSELADPIIEFDLKIDQYDSFEVSSPGLDRPLKSMADFIRYEGEVVIVKLYAAIDGEKEFVGPLVFTEDEVGIEQDGKKIMFPLAKVAHIKREVVF